LQEAFMKTRTICAAFATLATITFASHAQTPPAAAPASPATPAAPAAAPAPAATPAASSQPAAAGVETGLAAVYSDKLQGRKTASGQVYDRNKLTTAHKTLPFGTKVKVTNVKNDKSVVLVVNDRGPTQAGRVLDISPAAAKSLGFSPKAMAEVRVEVAEAAPSAKK
jgi:rare lipoprotein A